MSQRVYTPPSLGFTAAWLIAPVSFVGRPSRSDLELLHVTLTEAWEVLSLLQVQ